MASGVRMPVAEAAAANSQALHTAVDTRFSMLGSGIDAGDSGAQRSFVHRGALAREARTDAALLAWQAAQVGVVESACDGEALFDPVARDEAALGESVSAVETLFALLGV